VGLSRRCALLVPLLAAAPAGAATDHVTVVPILVEGRSGPELTRPLVLREVADVLAFHPGLRAATDEQTGDLDNVTQRIVNCGTDNSCVIERLRTLEPRYGLVALVDESTSPAFVSLQLFDVEARRLIGEKAGKLTSEERGLVLALRARLERLLTAAGFVAGGRLVAELQPPTALPLLVQGDREIAPDDTGGVTFTVPPGTYQLRARAEGHEPTTIEVQVALGRESRVPLKLPESSSFVESPWFWTAIGAVVAAGGTTAVLLATQQTSRCICLTLNGQGCGCPE
jgi:hypothetical protein